MLPKAGKPPAYMVVEYEITDRDAFQAYIKGADALPTSRVFLARHAKGTGSGRRNAEVDRNSQISKSGRRARV